MAKVTGKPQILGIPTDGLYTLVMIDPDAPPKEPGKAWLHWIVTNIPEGDISQGQEYVPYSAPTPPSGMHKYIFLLYKQYGSLTSGIHTNQRAGWSLQEFLKGKPLAEVARNFVNVTKN